MNNWTTLVLLAFASLASTAPRNNLREGLLKVITKWKRNDVASLRFPLPSLSNINLDDWEHVCDGTSASLKNIKLEGLETLEVRGLSVSESKSGMKASLQIYIPYLAITAEYKFSRSYWFKRVTYSGDRLRTRIEDITVLADAKFEADGANTLMTLPTLDLFVGDITTELSGSNFLDPAGECSDTLKDYLENEDNVRNATATFEEQVNEVLCGHTPEQIKNIIRGI